MTTGGGGPGDPFPPSADADFPYPGWHVTHTVGPSARGCVMLVPPVDWSDTFRRAYDGEPYVGGPEPVRVYLPRPGEWRIRVVDGVITVTPAARRG